MRQKAVSVLGFILKVACQDNTPKGNSSGTHYTLLGAGSYQLIAGFPLRADCFDRWHLVRPLQLAVKKAQVSWISSVREGGRSVHLNVEMDVNAELGRRTLSFHFFFPLFTRANNEPSEPLLGRGVNSDPFARNTLLVNVLATLFFYVRCLGKKAVLPGML